MRRIPWGLAARGATAPLPSVARRSDMPRSLSGALCALAILPGAAAAQEKPAKLKPDAIPGYKVRTVEGFTVIVSAETLKQNEASTLERKPLDVLEQELKILCGLMPPK